MKKIDLSKTIYELTEENPELIYILKSMGFMGVVNPIVRNTLGRKTTMIDGCKKMGKDYNEVVKLLAEKGYEVMQ